MNTEAEVCVLCCRKIEIYAYGNCFHAICHECCTRIRVLCGKTDCAICRQSLPEVTFSPKLLAFEKLDFSNKKNNSEYGIIFDTPDTERAFSELLEHSCNICTQRKVFANFMQLKDHMRRIHDKFYCNLCVDNTKLFSFERQVYSRTDLSHHRQFGDKDNTSLRAHPLCKFCNERYVDEDELYRHLRKDHFFCHFCDADGHHFFYCDYIELREHFKVEHYLCEDGECVNEQFTSVFRSDIDLKAHKASVHNKNMSRAKAKQARTLDVNFSLTPRPKRSHYYMDDNKTFDNGDKPSLSQKNKNGNENSSEKESAINSNSSSVNVKPEPAEAFYANDFPTLSNNGNGRVESVFRPPVWQGGKKLTSSSKENDFPSLSSNSTFTTSNWVLGNTTSDVSDNGSKKNSSKPNNSPQIVKKQGYVNDHNDFPWLTADAPVIAPSNWVVNNTNVVKDVAPKKKPEKATNLPLKLNDEFPRLNKKGKHTSDNGKSTSNAQLIEKTKPLQKKNLNQNKQVNNKQKYDENKSKKSSNENPYESFTHQNLYEVLDMNSFDEVAPSVTVKKKKEPEFVSFGAEDFPILGNPTTTNSSKSVAVNPPQPKPKPKVPDDRSKILRSLARVSVKDDSFSLAGLADSLNLSKKKNSKKNIVDENRPKKPLNGIKIENDENISSKPKSNSRINKANSITNSTEFSTKISLDALDNKFGKTNEYTPPDNFQQRNFDLIKKIQLTFNNSDSSFCDFKTVSGQFRQNEISADHYYEQCVKLLGNTEFLQVFPELLALLPDIKKQQELLLVNKRLQKKGKSDVDVKVCGVCQQVVAKQDFAVHKFRHT